MTLGIKYLETNPERTERCGRSGLVSRLAINNRGVGRISRRGVLNSSSSAHSARENFTRSRPLF